SEVSKGRARAVPSEDASGEAARSEAQPSEVSKGRARAVPSEDASGEAARSEAQPSEVSKSGRRGSGARRSAAALLPFLPLFERAVQADDLVQAAQQAAVDAQAQRLEQRVAEQRADGRDQREA